MKNPKETAQRWIKSAEDSLRQAKSNLQGNEYDLACFLAEQTCQKALKAVRYFDGARFIATHSIAVLIKKVTEKYPEFSAMISRGAKLDQYYLSSRYPDAVAEPATPSEIFLQEQAEEAIEIAQKIFELCNSKIS